MIKVNNLSKEFHEQGTSNELLAVDHVDFTIQNGSFCALVGESGSGKSTLAQLMCGLLVPSSGEVLFEGKNISLCRGKQKQVLRSKIQLILQDGKGAMDPRFTVYQIIAEPIRNFRKLSKKEEEREINDLLTMMELPEEIKLRKAHELSGGQQKRVCIARALAAQPDVLIFDEAVSGLDVLVRKHILDLLKRLHQERKMTCFFITHDLDVALYLADRVMVMRCGILNNQVVNSSRALHSLKHTVPKSHKNIAIHMVDHIRRLGVFPANYALDLGEFIDSNGNSYIDIVELNPISCSMCYVNNSIYADVVPEIGECQRQLMMGAEFCYDAIANPKNYDMLRISDKSYTYTSDNQYALL